MFTSILPSHQPHTIPTFNFFHEPSIAHHHAKVPCIDFSNPYTYSTPLSPWYPDLFMPPSLILHVNASPCILPPTTRLVSPCSRPNFTNYTPIPPPYLVQPNSNLTAFIYYSRLKPNYPISHRWRTSLLTDLHLIYNHHYSTSNIASTTYQIFYHSPHTDRQNNPTKAPSPR